MARPPFAAWLRVWCEVNLGIDEAKYFVDSLRVVHCCMSTQFSIFNLLRLVSSLPVALLILGLQFLFDTRQSLLQSTVTCYNYQRRQFGNFEPALAGRCTLSLLTIVPCTIISAKTQKAAFQALKRIIIHISFSIPPWHEQLVRLAQFLITAGKTCSIKDQLLS